MKYLLILFSFVIFISSLSAQSLNKLLEKGNDAYGKEDYSTAVYYYREAAKLNSAIEESIKINKDSPIAQDNSILEGRLALISLLRGGEGKIAGHDAQLDIAGNLSLNLPNNATYYIMYLGEVGKIEDINFPTSLEEGEKIMYLKKECGYIIYVKCKYVNRLSERYYRLFVNDYIFNEKNRNIGVEILYQEYPENNDTNRYK